MITEERRSKILRIAEELGFVSLQRLVAEVGVSESTVRRDLEFLDANGRIHRTRGRAAFSGDTLTDFDIRQNQASLEKRRIAQRTAELILPGETVLLDGGTTTLEVARIVRDIWKNRAQHAICFLEVLMSMCADCRRRNGCGPRGDEHFRKRRREGRRRLAHDG